MNYSYPTTIYESSLAQMYVCISGINYGLREVLLRPGKVRMVTQEVLIILLLLLFI